MGETHAQRIERIRKAYREAHDRLVARLRDAPEDLACRAAPAGGWSAVQIGWHVAAVDSAFADLIAGDRPSQALPEDFQERPWAEMAAALPQKIEASRAVVPPADVRRDEVLAALETSAAKLDAALVRLDNDRAVRFGVTHKVVGTVTLAQIGEWATAHTIRHNAQAKRALGR
jgi:uncharacterized damage-inducible protein DinB